MTFGVKSARCKHQDGFLCTYQLKCEMLFFWFPAHFEFECASSSPTSESCVELTEVELTESKVAFGFARRYTASPCAGTSTSKLPLNWPRSAAPAHTSSTRKPLVEPLNMLSLNPTLVACVFEFARPTAYSPSKSSLTHT